MAKFNVLESNQAYMAWLGIYSYHLTEPSNEFFKSIVACFFMFNSSVMIIGSSILFIIKYISEVQAVLGAFKIAISGIQCGGMHFSVGIKMKLVKALHLKLQQIVDEVNEGEISEIYWETEQKCQKYTLRLGRYVFFHTCVFPVSLLYAVYCIAIGNYDTSSWFLAYNVLVPFNMSTIIGWLMTWVYQWSMGLVYSLSVTSVTSYFVSCCFYIGTMCDHFTFIMHSITEDVYKNQSDEQSNLHYESFRNNIMQKLNNAVKLHVKIFDIFYMLAEINSGAIFALLPANAIFMSISMYDVEESATDWVSSPLVAFFSVSCILCSLFWPSFLCYFATVATSRISGVGDTAYDSNWYGYPLVLQRYIILIVGRSQEPVYFTGLNIIRCTLEVCGKLVKTSCSYYLIFRTFAHR